MWGFARKAEQPDCEVLRELSGVHHLFVWFRLEILLLGCSAELSDLLEGSEFGWRGVFDVRPWVYDQVHPVLGKRWGRERSRETKGKGEGEIVRRKLVRRVAHCPKKETLQIEIQVPILEIQVKEKFKVDTLCNFQSSCVYSMHDTDFPFIRKGCYLISELCNKEIQLKLNKHSTREIY